MSCNNLLLLGYLKKKKHKQKPPIDTGVYRQRCRHIGFTDDFVTKRNNK
jgi:hypothetical protein